MLTIILAVLCVFIIVRSFVMLADGEFAAFMACMVILGLFGGLAVALI